MNERGHRMDIEVMAVAGFLAVITGFAVRYIWKLPNSDEDERLNDAGD